MQKFRAEKLPIVRCAAIAVLLIGLPLAGCATPSLSSLGLGPHADSKVEEAQALAAAVKAPTPDPLANVESSIREAQRLRKGGDLQTAARTLSQLMLFAPDNPHLLGEYGKTLVAQGRSDDALAFLERAVQLQTADWSLYSAQGVAYDQQAQYRAAQTFYARALSLKPGEPTVLNNAALSHMQAGDLAAAEKLLAQIGSGAADYPRIAQNLALVQSLRAAQAKAYPAEVAASVLAAAPMQAPAPVMSTSRAPDPMLVAAEIVKAPPPAPVPVPQPVIVQRIALPVAQVAPPPAPKPVPVRTVAMAPTKPQAARPANSTGKTAYYVQAGAYGSSERAGRIARELDSLGARVSPTTVGGQPVYRVRIGPFLDAEQAGTAVSHAREMGHADIRIVAE